MLRVNRLKVNIIASNKNYCFDECFNPGLNFIASDDNTKGKSSVLIAIYYALGFESIIGGLNEKVLTSVYKNAIVDDEGSWPVLESGVYLELCNGNDVVTIYRAAKHESRDVKLITVYFSSIDEMYNSETTYEDYYVNMPDAARNKAGFHRFLEQFIGLKLPLVATTDGTDRKLYLQVIFAAMFIEQKNGWSGIYSGMPYLSIKDSKKRVTEYILNLHTFENERERNKLINKEKYQKELWGDLYRELVHLQNKTQCIVKNIPISPEILDEDFAQNVSVVRAVGEQIDINDWISELEEEKNELTTIRPRIIDNYEELQTELSELENTISDNNEVLGTLQEELLITRRKLEGMRGNIDIIHQDIINNKDAKRLQNLGSQLNCACFQGVCPTCNQKIKDTLLPVQQTTKIMSIDENINHLTAQKQMLEYAIKFYRERIEQLKTEIQDVRSKNATLLRLAKAIRRDLYSVDEDLSETIIYKRINIEHHIEELNKFKEKVDDIVNRFIEFSETWKELLKKKSQLPKRGYSNEEQEILKLFEDNFIFNLKEYNYTSISDVNCVEISKDNYLPIIDNFDMKFGSSASDNIRAIWSYTMALAQTSQTKGGNHPGMLIFDEPAQHSIGADDSRAFFNSIIKLGEDYQVIVGITINSNEVKNVIEQLDSNTYNMIHIKDRAFE